MKLSIIIPAHNEEQRLPPVLESYAAFFAEQFGNDVEILVVVNGSTDQTAAVSNRIAEIYPQIKVIEDTRRIGKGGAIILGAKAATGDWIGFVDADGATRAEEFYRLYQVAQQADGVIASRWMKNSTVNIHQTGLRLLTSRLFNLMIRVLLGLTYTDTQCGAKIFKAEAWRKILPNIGITRFAFDVDMLYQLKQGGYRVIEEPTVWNDVAGSKVQMFQSSFDMFCAVIRMRLLYSPFRFVIRFYERFFSRTVEYLRKDPLFCHAMLISGASLLASICNITYQMIMGRVLPHAEYALLASFLALITIAMRPLGTLETAMNHYTSVLIQEGRQGAIGRLILKWSALTAIPSLILSFIAILCSSWIANYFHLDRVAPVIVTAVALPVLCISPVLSGVIGGLQWFGWSAVSGIIGAFGRVLLGGLFVCLLYPACGWALVGHVGGMYVSFLVILGVLLPIILKRKKDEQSLPSMRFYIIQCFLIQLCAGVLMNGDVVMVKHYLPDNTDFAFASTLGRMVVFLSVAVASAMFPKVSTSGAFTKEHRAVYFRSLLYTSCFVAISMLICLLFPGWLSRFLFNITEPSSELINLTRGMSVVMAVATILNINLCLLLAQRRFKLLLVFVVCALFYMGAVHLWHASVYSVVWFAGITNVIALIITSIGIYKEGNAGHHEGNYEKIA